MLMHIAVRLLLGFSLLTALGGMGYANAISADLDTGLREVAAGNGGTSAFFAYSRRDNPGAAGPNSYSDFFQPIGGFTTPVPVANGVAISVTRFLATDLYAPVVGVDNIPKPTGQVGDRLRSLSPFGVAAGQTEGDAGLYYKAANQKYYVYGEAHSNEPFSGGRTTGAAAGAAFDPFQLTPNTYPYAQTLDASFLLTGDGASGGVNYYALDSRLTDLKTFFERGQPLQETLWYLTIDSDAPSISPSSLHVKFQSNLLARSLGILQLPLSDSQITINVENKLMADSNAGTISLTDLSLFPSGSSLVVRREDGTIDFGMAVASGLQVVPVPEPNTLLLVSTAGLAVLVGRKAQQRAIPFIPRLRRNAARSSQQFRHSERRDRVAFLPREANSAFRSMI